MVHIVTDTTSGLAPDVAAQYDIPVIPQIIHFGDDSYRECEEMDSKMFMERLLRSETLPKTAAPSPEWFHEHLRRRAIAIRCSRSCTLRRPMSRPRWLTNCAPSLEGSRSW